MFTTAEQARTAPNFDIGRARGEIKRGLAYMALFTGAIFLLARVLVRGDPPSSLNSWHIWLLPFLCVFSVLTFDRIRRGLGPIVFYASAFCLLALLFSQGNLESVIKYWYNFILPFVFLFSMPLVAIHMGVLSLIEGTLCFIRKNNWIESARQTKATIVDKRSRVDYEHDEYYSYEVIVFELKLEYAPILATTKSSQLTVWAGVSTSVYEKYERQDTVTIYYSVADLSVFLIAGE
jgi:hypothetical protein